MDKGDVAVDSLFRQSVTRELVARLRAGVKVQSTWCCFWDASLSECAALGRWTGTTFELIFSVDAAATVFKAWSANARAFSYNERLVPRLGSQPR